MNDLTIESLAKTLMETGDQACLVVGWAGKRYRTWENASESDRKFLLEQARLLFERIMR